MSYDIGNLGLKGGERKKTWVYVAAAVVVIVVVATVFALGWIKV